MVSVSIAVALWMASVEPFDQAVSWLGKRSEAPGDGGPLHSLFRLAHGDQVGAVSPPLASALGICLVDLLGRMLLPAVVSRHSDFTDAV